MSLQRKDLKPSFRIQNLEEFFSREAYNQFVVYSAFEIDKPHRHNQNLIRTFLGSSLLWSTEMKAAVNAQKLRRKKIKHSTISSQISPFPRSCYAKRCMTVRTYPGKLRNLVSRRYLCVKTMIYCFNRVSLGKSQNRKSTLSVGVNGG